MPRIIGLTGGIASGKSTVSSIWSSAGVTIIDADEIAREVVKPGKPAHWLIARYFGGAVLNPDGTLNRTALGHIIFSHHHHRVALNRRTHPFIICTMLSRLFHAIFIRWHTVVVLDTPLLFETRTLLPICSRTVVVNCRFDQQIDRMMQRDSGNRLSKEDAEKRLASQMPLEEKAARADVVIDNSGDLDELKANALNALESLRPSRAGETVFRAILCASVSHVVVKLCTKLCS